MARAVLPKLEKAATDAPPPEETKVFLSYSRKEVATLQLIADALITHPEFQPDFDKAEHDPDKVGAGISADEPWWQRLEQMIAGAEAMVFLVSPHSAASKVCDEEIAYAQRLGKRIIPVLAGAVDFAKLPPKLNSLNIAIDFTESGPGFDAALAHLIRVLSVNAAWLREGRRYTERAADWDRKGHPKGGLLPTGAFEEAEAWAARRPKNESEPGELFTAWIAASRANIQEQLARERRQIRRAQIWQAAAALILVGGFAALAHAGLFLVSEQRAFAKSKSLTLARTADRLLADGDPRRALLLSILASRETALAPSTPEAQASFASSAQALKQLIVIKHKSPVIGAVFSNDETLILSWDVDNTVQLWNVATGTQVGSTIQHESDDLSYLFDGEAAERFGAALSADSNRIFTWADGTVRVWGVSTGKQIAHSPLLDHPIWGAKLFNDGSRILTWDLDGVASVLDTTTGKQLSATTAHNMYVSGAIISNDDTRILSWGGDNEVRLWDVAPGAEVGRVFVHDYDVEGARFSKDESKILTWSGEVQYGEEIVTSKGDARLWNARTGRQIGPALLHKGPVLGATFSENESLVLTWSGDGTARIWSAETGEQIGPGWRHEDTVNGAAFSKDETRILTWSEDGTARIWEAGSGVRNDLVLLHEDNVVGASFSDDDAYVLTWSDDNTARLWDTSTGVQIGSSLQHEGPVSGATLSSDENHILTWSRDGTVRVWDAAADSQVGPLLSHELDLNGATLSNDERHLLSWGGDFEAGTGAAQLWNVATGNQIDLLSGSYVKGAKFSKDNSKVLTWGGQYDKKIGTAQLWDSSTGSPIAPSLQHNGFVIQAQFAKDETLIFTRSTDDTARLWDVTTGAQKAAVSRPNLGGAAISKNGDVIITWTYATSNDHAIWLHDPVTGHRAGPPIEHKDSVQGAIFSNDNTKILSWSDDGSLRLWDTAKRKQIVPDLLHDGSVLSAAFSRDETNIISRSADNAVRIWNAETGTQIGPTLQHEGFVFGATYSKDESHILTWSRDETENAWSVQIWNAGKGDRAGPALQHFDDVYGATLSSDETRVLTWSRDGNIRLWDTATGVQIGPALQHPRFAWSAMFSKDETRIISVGNGDTSSIRFWDVSWAMRKLITPKDLAYVCQKKLLGSVAITSTGSEAPLTRLIDDETVQAAPILRGREGEDVCAAQQLPWWDEPLQLIIDWAGME